MGKIDFFEDLEIWQEAKEISKIAYTLTMTRKLNKNHRFRVQFRASAGSITDNIAEGFERGRNKEFMQFLFVAK